ncbi:MAG: hypothetical protein ACRCZI_04725 [Cetobacterium sp.]
MITTEIYYEIFRYLRPNERMILNEIDCIKLYYQNFVKSFIWPKLFKDLRPNGFRSCNRPDSVNEIKFETQRGFTIIKELNINEFSILECDQINEVETGLISHFIILGKNITKVELYDCHGIVDKQFFLKKDIVAVLPQDTCFMSSQFSKIKIKVYADSVNKIFAKKYFLKNDDFITLMNNAITFDTFIYNESKIHMFLIHSEGICYFRYELNYDNYSPMLYKICRIYESYTFLKYAKKYPISICYSYFIGGALIIS